MRHEVGRGTIAKALMEAGIQPAPDRKKKTTWKEFLRRPWEVMAAVNFFCVEVWTALGLVRYHAFFVVRLATREVPIAGLSPKPNGPWMKQVALNLTDPNCGFLKGCRYLLHDRVSVFNEDFRMFLKAADIESFRLPARFSNLNAFAERFALRIEESCLVRTVLIEEASLHRATTQFVLYYHHERNHQELENTILRPELSPLPTKGFVKCRKRLRGILNYYYRDSA